MTGYVFLLTLIINSLWRPACCATYQKLMAYRPALRCAGASKAIHYVGLSAACVCLAKPQGLIFSLHASALPKRSCQTAHVSTLVTSRGAMHRVTCNFQNVRVVLLS